LAQVRNHGEIDASDRAIDEEFVQAIVKAAPDRHIESANFAGATFQGGADLAGVGFGEVDFGRATFEELVRIGPTERATFRDACFRGPLFLRSPRGDLCFDRAVFVDRVQIEHTPDRDSAHVTSASFDGADFQADARIALHCRGRVSFNGAVFSGSTGLLGPLVADEVFLVQTKFEHPVRIYVLAADLVCVEASFQGQVTLVVLSADVMLDRAQFTQSSTIASGPLPGHFRFFDQHDHQRRRSSFPGDARASVVSLRSTDVQHVTLSNVDVGSCHFAGCFNLDRVRMSNVTFAESPSTPSVLGLRRWTPRRVIAEEHDWRLDIQKRREWASLELVTMGGLRLLGPKMAPPTVAQVAEIYRDLRTGQEARNDTPGAGDLYYGEMEMRRAASHTRYASVAHPTHRSERALLSAYWAVSGYGLRPARALIALAATVLVFALLFDRIGFTREVGLPRAVLFSAQSTSSLFRAPDPAKYRLSDEGEALQLFLRLAGPLFFGLALLAFRGRLKR
jgi:uncharacterized protein YjbI with pentapeptide repeats